MKRKEKTFFGGYDKERSIFWGEVELVSKASGTFLLKCPSKPNLPFFHSNVFSRGEWERLSDGDLVILWQSRKGVFTGRRITVR